MTPPATQPDAALPTPTPGHGWTRVADSASLEEGGLGIRFTVASMVGERIPAFAVRFDGTVRAYLNRCAHVPVELDWQEGRFFDDSGLYLICATHGAMYNADDGRCAGGPCRGKGLTPLRSFEAGGVIWVETINETGAR